MSSPEKLVRMANQIAQFFDSQPGTPEDKAQSIAAHLNDFWAPQMRADIMAMPVEAKQELLPSARAALEHLRLPA